MQMMLHNYKERQIRLVFFYPHIKYIQPILFF